MAKTDTFSRLRAILGSQPPPPYGNPNVIPGIGGYRRELHKRARKAAQQLPDNSIPRWRDSHPIQQAPYKPGQTRQTQRYKRRHPGTRPTPGSVYGRRQPQPN
jgi:hypothetical protein